jgi:hypothetical protein
VTLIIIIVLYYNDCVLFLFRIETDETSQEEPKQDPFCQLFKGSVCSTHIGNKSIYVTSRYAQGLREEKVICKIKLFIFGLQISLVLNLLIKVGPIFVVYFLARLFAE